MSRILRRPMFRGGSTNNGGIMSYAQPRKGYEKAGPVIDGFENEEEIGQNETTTTSPMSYQRSDFIDGPQMKKESSNIQQQNKTYKAFGQDVEQGSIGDVMLKEYLGNRSDPTSKFLINFGLNYMSARPRGGKFGAFATAADAAKKPTEQLYADMDTDRLLKLKLMGALSKSESTGAFEKRVKAEFKYDQELPEGERRFKSLSDAARYVSRIDSEKKQETVEERIGKREQSIASKSISATSDPLITRNQAEILERDKYKLGKDIEKLANRATFDITDNLKQKPNSTDFTYPKASTGLLDSFKTGRIYVDADTRIAFEYMGNNIFRPVKKL
jgi:hypothetical protein